MTIKIKIFEEDDDGLENAQDRINKFLSQNHIAYEDMKISSGSAGYMIFILSYREKDKKCQS